MGPPSTPCVSPRAALQWLRKQVFAGLLGAALASGSPSLVFWVRPVAGWYSESSCRSVPSTAWPLATPWAVGQTLPGCTPPLLPGFPGFPWCCGGPSAACLPGGAPSSGLAPPRACGGGSLALPAAPGWAGSLHRVSTGGCAVFGPRTPRACGGGSPALPVGSVRVFFGGARRVCKQVSAQWEHECLRCQLPFAVAAAPPLARHKL